MVQEKDADDEVKTENNEHAVKIALSSLTMIVKKLNKTLLDLA